MVWATGFRRAYPWLKVPVLDAAAKSGIRAASHREPGLYVIGLHFLSRRNSSFIDGVGADAQAIATPFASPPPERGRHDRAVRRPDRRRPRGRRRHRAAAGAGRPRRAGDRSRPARQRHALDPLADAARVLQLLRWGALPRLIAAGTPPIRGSRFYYGDGATTVGVKNRDGIDALFAPRRTVLDRVLIDMAAEAGARVLFGSSLRDTGGGREA